MKVDRLGNVHGSDGRFITKTQRDRKNEKKTPVKAKVVKEKLPTSTGLTHISFCIDVSYSMRWILKKTTEVLNYYIQQIVENDKKYGQKSTVGIVKFSSKVEVFRKNSPVDCNTKISKFEPENNTALYGGIYKSIEQLENISSDKDSCLVYILTDGMENATSYNIREKCINKIKNLSLDKKWTFVFLVPDATSVGYISNYGISQANIQIWTNTEEGLDKVEEITTNGLNNYYILRSSGVQSTKNFFGYQQLNS